MIRLPMQFALGRISDEEMVGSKEGKTVTEIELEIEFFHGPLRTGSPARTSSKKSGKGQEENDRISAEELTSGLE